MTADFESWCRIVLSYLHDDGYERDVPQWRLGELYDKTLAPQAAANIIKVQQLGTKS